MLCKIRHYVEKETLTSTNHAIFESHLYKTKLHLFGCQIHHHLKLNIQQKKSPKLMFFVNVLPIEILNFIKMPSSQIFQFMPWMKTKHANIISDQIQQFEKCTITRPQVCNFQILHQHSLHTYKCVTRAFLNQPTKILTDRTE